MKITTGNLLVANEALAKLGEMELPISTAAKVARLAKKVELEAMPFVDLRNKLIRKYGEPQEGNPQAIWVPPTSKNAIKFITEVNELLLQELEVDFPKFKLPDGDFNIKPDIIKGLLDFLED